MTSLFSGHQRALAAAFTSLAMAKPDLSWRDGLSGRYIDAWSETMNGPRGPIENRRSRTECSTYYQWLHDTLSAYQDNNWLVDYSLWFESRSFDSVTEIGCGNGRFLRTIAPKVGRVVGLDWALSATLADLPQNVSVQKCDLTVDPVPASQLICSADVLEHIAPDDISDVVVKLHAAGPSNFHAIACYDDGHSHLTIMPPDAWLKLFRTVSSDYQLLGVDVRRNNPNTLVCLITNFSG
jgi:SAM-dependent methyltransferase